MSRNFFIAGTDTDAGKTLITEALLLKANEAGLRTLGLKPVAAGADETADGPRNADALKLMQASSVKLPYRQVNPVLFRAPIAPHIAAQQEGRLVTVNTLTGYVRGAMMTPADLRLVEGAGGWLVPLNDREPLSALVQQLQLDVILVVGMKLGCLNHALLTAQVIRQAGLKLAGFVATQVDVDMSCVDENLQSLKQMLGCPCLGFVPFIEGIDAWQAAGHLQLPV